jgi:hypothetical protein
VAEKLHLREAVRLMDERDRRGAEIEDSVADVVELTEETENQEQAVADMTRQSNLGSYSRIRLGGRR